MTLARATFPFVRKMRFNELFIPKTTATAQNLRNGVFFACRLCGL